MLPYYEMAYLQDHGSWFWLAEKDEGPQKKEVQADRGGGEGRWVWVPAEDGFRQGSPLSCMLAALAGVKCVRAAQQAMDQFYGLERGLDGGDTGDAVVQTPEHIEQMRVVHDLDVPG